MQDVSTLPLTEGCLADPGSIRLPHFPLWRRLRRPVEIIFWSVSLFVITQLFVVQGYRVYGSCMEPNICTGERLLGSKLAVLTGVQRGDVVVFRAPHKPGTAFIKRVIGLPGDRLEIRNSHVYVNGRLLTEPYLHRTWHDSRPLERIPSDKVFVMGDNRDNSNDSRMWGLLPVANIQAKAWLRYWPLDRIEAIH